jgi:hypothetical protein
VLAIIYLNLFTKQQTHTKREENCVYVCIVIYLILDAAEVKLPVTFIEREGGGVRKLTPSFRRLCFLNAANNLNGDVYDSVTAGTWRPSCL